jgi:hypothetical protein
MDKMNLQVRPWREISFVDRLVRIAVYAGGASFVGFWVIAKWLQGAALIQPRVETGIYRHAHLFHGHVRFLTDGQAAWADVGHFLAYGWFLAFGAGCWAVIVESKAAKTRVDSFLRNYPASGGRPDV